MYVPISKRRGKYELVKQVIGTCCQHGTLRKTWVYALKTIIAIKFVIDWKIRYCPTLYDSDGFMVVRRDGILKIIVDGRLTADNNLK